MLLVMACVRIYTLSEMERGKVPVMPALRLRLFLCVGLSVTAMVLLVGRYVESTLQTYDIIRLSILIPAWFVAALILVLESQKNTASDYSMQLWFVAAFTVAVIRLQTVLTLENQFHWEIIFTFIDLLFTLLIAALAWLHNGDPDLLKENEAKDAAAALGKSIQSESTPLMIKDKTAELVGPRFPRSPEESANVFSKMLFLWTNSLYRLGLTHALQENDLWPLIDNDKTEAVSRQFDAEWSKELNRPREQRSLKMAVWRTFRGEFILGGLYKLINDVLVFAGPLILNLLIQFVSTPAWPLWYGVLFALGIFLASMIQTAAVNTYFYRMYRVGMRARGAMVAVVYKKAFDISNEGRQDYTTGEITNLMSVDSSRLQNLTPYLHMVWSSFLQIGVALYLLYQQVGASVFAGLGFMILMVPLNIFLMKRLSVYQRLIMMNKDKRLKIMSEILNGMRIIKFFAWEESYIGATNTIRQVEVDTLRASSYLRATTLFSWMVTPVFVALFTFLSFTLSGHELTASIAFTSVALFNVLRFPLNMLPSVLSNLVDSNIALGRISKYLNNDNRDCSVIEWNKVSDPNIPFALRMEGATFGWSPGNPALHDLSFSVPKGKLVALVGGVGSGKSSVLSAFLGEMAREKGRAIINGSVAYASQQAWIQNASVKDNILFGLPFHALRYEQTIQACQLQPDIDILPNGDLTEIGEKGINLSGGQKQRVSLARAVYANKDVYLLDDVLSAVDVHVGRAIFDNVLRGLLKGKSILVVTHQLQYLPNVDSIITLANGRISEEGTYSELMASRGAFFKLISEYSMEGAKAAGNDNNAPDTVAAETAKVVAGLADKKAPADKTSKGGIVAQEEREVGRLNGRIALSYGMACGGVAVMVLVGTILIIEAGSNVGTNIWLSIWSGDPGMLEHPLLYWLGIYTCFGVVTGVATWTRAIVVARAGVAASYNLHNNLLRRIMRAPTSFFDSTPTGRILNRFSSDIYTIDESLPFTLGMLASMLFACIATLGIISFVTPLFLVFLFPLGYIYRYTQQYYIASSRELKRLDSISRSPIYNHFTETIDGVTVVRSYDMEGVFVETNRQRLDANQRAYFCFQVSNRWLAVRLETIGNVIVGLASLFAVFSRGSLSGGLAGLSVSYSLQMTGTLNWLVRQSTEAETQMVSVERVLQYSQVPQEPPAELPGREPPAEWPQSGTVQFNNFKLRYRKDLDLVLDGITINVGAMEKIGIVGRTGAGKSSLVLALFRFVDAAEGSISIDGIDISSIGTNRLRRCITIIPQDPVLFVGSVRRNLDPFGEHSDDVIWRALERVFLKEDITAKGGLDFVVAEGGENFSVGQRQLFCMARALLRPAKVLIMDEATSNVDAQSDALIQRTIREAFADR